MARTKQHGMQRMPPPTLFKLSLRACAEEEVVKFEVKVFKRAQQLNAKRRRIVRDLGEAIDRAEDEKGGEEEAAVEKDDQGDHVDQDDNQEFDRIVSAILNEEGVSSLQKLFELRIRERLNLQRA